MKITHRTKLSDTILCMSNVRGSRVKNPCKLPFSFYFSGNPNVGHDIRVKPSFNAEKLRIDQTGTLQLCDSWTFTPPRDSKNINQSEINEMKNFFKQYISLFCAVWDYQLTDGDLEDYFLGRIEFEDLIKELEFYGDYKESLDKLQTVEDFEAWCRRTNVVNLHGN